MSDNIITLRMVKELKDKNKELKRSDILKRLRITNGYLTNLLKSSNSILYKHGVVSEQEFIDNLKIFIKCNPNMSPNKISTILDVPRLRVKKALKEMGYSDFQIEELSGSSNRGSKFDVEQLSLFIKEHPYHSGKDVAKALNYKYESLYHFCKDKNIYLPTLSDAVCRCRDDIEVELQHYLNTYPSQTNENLALRFGIGNYVVNKLIKQGLLPKQVI